MIFLKNILKRRSKQFFSVLQILCIQTVFSMTVDEIPRETLILKKEIHIAYVEDSLMFRNLVSRMVKSYNEKNGDHTVKLTLHIHEDEFIKTYSALEDLNHFDIIFTDMQMNEMHSGFLVAEYLRELKYSKPIIVLSSDHAALQEYSQNRNPESVYHEYSHCFEHVSSIRAKLNHDTLRDLLEQYVVGQQTAEASTADFQFYDNLSDKEVLNSLFSSDEVESKALQAFQEHESPRVFKRLRAVLLRASNIYSLFSPFLKCSQVVSPDR
ncbi:MAG: hypothetical protein C0432_04205 [Candidatus Puniceispirillum sp.]|nr:hypothetical protein [Candidatus Pelagibacter sp.]MBA4283478.1 hypothetical protein [Candidatus Puniceispirillum sp.]